MRDTTVFQLEESQKWLNSASFTQIVYFPEGAEIR